MKASESRCWTLALLAITAPAFAQDIASLPTIAPPNVDQQGLLYGTSSLPRPPTVVIPSVRLTEPDLRMDLGHVWYTPSPLPLATGAPDSDLSRAKAEAAINRLRAERDAALSRRQLLQVIQTNTRALDEQITRLDQVLHRKPGDPVLFDIRITPTPTALVPGRPANP